MKKISVNFVDVFLVLILIFFLGIFNHIIGVDYHLSTVVPGAIIGMILTWLAIVFQKSQKAILACTLALGMFTFLFPLWIEVIALILCIASLYVLHSRQKQNFATK